jgi:tetratricopeptide (TPR) repeat protein
MPHRTLRPMAAACLVVGTAGPALAILEEPPAEVTPPAAALCVGGAVWHDASASCVDPALGLVGDEALFAALSRHADAGRYDWAKRILSAMRERDTPRVLTAEGFLLRRTGQVAEGLALYAQALALDPGYHRARAYWGLWHLEEGDIAGARAWLAEIEAAGGRGGEAWQVLAEALRAAAGAD